MLGVWEEQGENSGLVPEPEHLSLIMLYAESRARKHSITAVFLWEECHPVFFFFFFPSLDFVLSAHKSTKEYRL